MTRWRNEDDSPQTIRYAPSERSWEPAAEGDPATTEAIERHIARHFGEPATVWHEIVSDRVHIDVHVVEPTDARPYFTLVTTGMSDLPMTVPSGDDSSQYAEMMISLPPDWPLSQEAFRDERAYWPIRLLKVIARLPHEYQTWIAEWHTVPNGDPAEPYAPDCPFTGVLLAPMIRCAPEARTIEVDGGKVVTLLALIPLHPAEMDLKLAQGAGALIDAFDRAGVSELLDPARSSSV
jgi:hypothetical protein